MDIDQYKEFIDLSDKRKKLKAEVAQVEAELREKEGLLIDELLDNDMNKLSIGDKTVYISNTLWANVKKENKQLAIQALRDAGYDDYLKESYNMNQLSKMLRTFVENEETSPFEGIIDGVLKTVLKVVKT